MAETLTSDQIIEAVSESTREVFETMLGSSIEQKPNYVERTAPLEPEGVVALVGLAGPWVGTGAIACTADFACKLCSMLLMTEATAVNDDVLDAIGEIANMIIGSFKTRMEQVLGPLGLSIPTVIYGRNFTARSFSNGEWTVVPFECQGETLRVKVCLTPSESMPARQAAAHPTVFA